MPGVKGASGRKTRLQEWGLQVTLDRYFTVRDRKEVIKKLIELAKGGSIDAAKILLAYLWGRPRQQIEHSGELELAVGRLSNWEDVKQLCIEENIDVEMVRHETRRLLQQAEADDDDDGWTS